MWNEVMIVLIKGIILIGALFTAAAYMTFLERVVMARLQLRLGPNRVGPFGLLQPIADGIKLLTKERFQPAGVDTFIYWFAPAISLFSALFIFALIPVGLINIGGQTVYLQIANIDAGILFLLAISSLAVYGVVLAGWGSNNRYSLLGGLRGTAQMISYEIPMGLSLLTVVLATGSLNLREIVELQEKGHWFIWTHPLSFIIYVITAFAETNRAPFDLPEAEQELTAGYHTEYGGMKFAIFFLGEYINILAISSIATTLFLGGWEGPWNIPVLWFALKVACFVFFFMWVRATLPRFRYDQLMSFGWKILLPLALLNLIVTAYFILV
jgi:NADH-quinone oxidoreductase subunit H